MFAKYGKVGLMTKTAKLLWVDLEMTGLSPCDDRIMEVAAIVTDWDFKELARFEAIQKVDEELIEARMVGDFWDANDNVRRALKEQNSRGLSPAEVEVKLLALVSENFTDDEPVLLAGNSIHQDRKFIENEWPELNKKLHYRMLDVSAFKVLFDGKYGKRFSKPEVHRAMEDIRGSIEELKYYLKRVKI